MPTRLPARPLQSGFTLVELMMVVVVVAILASVGAPSMREMMVKQRVRTVSSDVYASIVLTRAEAIKRNVSVTLAPVGGNWQSGWTITTTYGGAPITVETKDAPASVTWYSSTPTSIVYGANGRTTGTADVEFRFSSSEYATVPMRCITISPSGRPNIKTDTDRNTSNGCN